MNNVPAYGTGPSPKYKNISFHQKADKARSHDLREDLDMWSLHCVKQKTNTQTNI